MLAIGSARVWAQSTRQLEGAISFAHLLAAEAAESLGHWGCVPEVAASLHDIPDLYCDPNGEFLLALAAYFPVGCVAYRMSASDECAMQFLYVRQSYRGQSIGRKMCESLIDHAETAGYRWMITAVHRQSIHAQHLLRSLGFLSINEEGDLLTFERKLVPGFRLEGIFLGDRPEVPSRALSREKNA